MIAILDFWLYSELGGIEIWNNGNLNNKHPYTIPSLSVWEKEAGHIRAPERDYFHFLIFIWQIKSFKD